MHGAVPACIANCEFRWELSESIEWNDKLIALSKYGRFAKKKSKIKMLCNLSL